MGCANSLPQNLDAHTVYDNHDGRMGSEERIRRQKEEYLANLVRRSGTALNYGKHSEEVISAKAPPYWYNVDTTSKSFLSWDEEDSMINVAPRLSKDSALEYKEPSQTILIFDWDDTLCPSSWMRQNVSFNAQGELMTVLSDRELADLEVLSARIIDILNLASKLGRVVFVTNAQRPWVDVSCSKILPNVQAAIENIPIIYAMEHLSPKERTGQSKYVGGTLLTESKARAMKVAVSEFYSRYERQSWKNIVSVGDAFYEHDAIRRVTRDQLCSKQTLKKCRTKTVKMIEGPTVPGMAVQLTILTEWLSKIVLADHDIDINFSADAEKVAEWCQLYGADKCDYIK